MSNKTELQNEKISVIVPAYNVEPYIHRCIDSILEQTYTDFELILVDDGSPDSCGAICDEYALKDNRIHVIHQSNTGQAIARNHGLDWLYQNSTSEWIMFVDSDDWIHPRMLELLLLSAQRFDTKISICGYEETSGSESDLLQFSFEPLLIDTEKFFCKCNVNAITPWGKLYHRSLFENIRYPNIRACEDEFVTYKILFEFEKILYIDAPLYKYFTNRESTARGKWKPSRLAAIDAMEERAEYFKKRGNKKMYHKSLISVICVHMNQIRDLREADEVYKKKYRMPIIKSAIKKAIAYRKEFTLLGYRKVWYPFIAAMFPRLFMLYKGLKGKVENDNHRIYPRL